MSDQKPEQKLRAMAEGLFLQTRLDMREPYFKEDDLVRGGLSRREAATISYVAEPSRIGAFAGIVARLRASIATGHRKGCASLRDTPMSASWIQAPHVRLWPCDCGHEDDARALANLDMLEAP